MPYEDTHTGWFFTGTPQFQYQKENPPSNQSWPFLVKRFIRTAALIGWLAVFFLVLKSGGTSEKSHPVIKTSQELRMLSSVTLDCQVTKIVMNSGSQL